jgi:hypothetical protein
MEKHDDAVNHNYPIGRGYGHDYMRGGEVLGGYGYADREEYEKPIGERESDRNRSSGDERREAT